MHIDPIWLPHRSWPGRPALPYRSPASRRTSFSIVSSACIIANGIICWIASTLASMLSAPYSCSVFIAAPSAFLTLPFFFICIILPITAPFLVMVLSSQTRRYHFRSRHSKFQLTIAPNPRANNANDSALLVFSCIDSNHLPLSYSLCLFLLSNKPFKTVYFLMARSLLYENAKPNYG